MANQVLQYSELLVLRKELGNKHSSAMEYLDVLLKALDTVKLYECLLDAVDINLTDYPLVLDCWEGKHEPGLEGNPNLCINCGAWLGE